MEEFIKVDKAKYGIETDNGMQLVDLRTLESVRDIIKEFNSEKETGLDFSSGESALVRLVDYKLINSSPYFMGFHMDGCSSTSYRYDEIDIIYRKLWAEKGISLSSAETLISADSAIIRCRKNIPKKKGNPKLYPSVNWKRVREEYASDEEIEQFAFSIATIGNYMPAPIEEQFLLGKLGERFDKELRLIRAYYNPTAYLDMEMIFSEEIQNWLKMFCRNYPSRDDLDWKHFVDSNYLKGSFVNDEYDVIKYDDSLGQLSQMIMNRAKLMINSL